MKRSLLIVLGLALALLVQAASPAPNVGNGRIRVLGNNLENYYIHPNTGRGDYTEAQIAAKTQKIVAAMLEADADIYAFCEVEAQPTVLQHLAEEMSAAAGVTGLYVAVDDGIEEEWDEQYNNNIKSGFIYRSDKVEPYGSDMRATNQTYYRNTMRIQAWEELSSGERFTLSMNHFKAMSDASSAAKRVDNANWLVSALSNSSKVLDPDILILGDLNCQMDEEAITIIVNAGFTEQLLRFDDNAYSYIYHGDYELIDHAFANSTMAEQITGAAVWHANTSASYSSQYSDHDPYLVAMNLGDPVIEEDCEAIHFSETFSTGLGQFTTVNSLGSSEWIHNSNYSCAYINAYTTAPDEDWLVSPAFDLTNQISGEIRFQHALGYGSSDNWPNQCQLLMSADYTDDVTTATWTSLTITEWSSRNYEWKDNNIAIPDSFLGQTNVHFAFHYDVASSAPAWEIKNLTFNTVCQTPDSTAVENIPTRPSVQKIIRHGQIIIIRGGVEYTITGQRL